MGNVKHFRKKQKLVDKVPYMKKYREVNIRLTFLARLFVHISDLRLANGYWTRGDHMVGMHNTFDHFLEFAREQRQHGYKLKRADEVIPLYDTLYKWALWADDEIMYRKTESSKPRFRVFVSAVIGVLREVYEVLAAVQQEREYEQARKSSRITS